MDIPSNNKVATKQHPILNAVFFKPKRDNIPT